MNGKKKKCPEKNKSRTLNRLSCIYLKCMEKKLTSYLCRHLTFLAIRLVSILMWTGATECLLNVQMLIPYWVTGRVNLERHIPSNVRVCSGQDYVESFRILV